VTKGCFSWPVYIFSWQSNYATPSTNCLLTAVHASCVLLNTALVHNRSVLLNMVLFWDFMESFTPGREIRISCPSFPLSLFLSLLLACFDSLTSCVSVYCI
jgi:hypothetical protein